MRLIARHAIVGATVHFQKNCFINVLNFKSYEQSESFVLAGLSSVIAPEHILCHLMF